MLRFCSGVNGLNHSSPWSASGQCFSPSKLTSPPSYLQHSPILDAHWESLCPKLLLSQLIYIQRSDGRSAQSLSLESRRCHLILSLTRHLSLFSVTPPSHFVCSLAHSLTHSGAHFFTHSPTYARSLFGFSAPPSESYHSRSWDLLWHTALVWFISYGKWEWKPPLRGENALTPQPDP